ncbi:MAG: PEP-CTERM sorting domain-containing protein [Candidatus Accumulibacter meliphilus]|jgi:hypothetical protein|uniref:PEP-CTERM sorting domain-containing protein n=1 Tax=Candidatus Accumulibacter meliphilus TaxID=2211374 RepID=UPI002FC39987
MNPVFQAPANDEYDGGRDLKKVLCSQRTRAHLLKDLAMKNKMIRVAIAALALGGAVTANAALFDVAAFANSSSEGVGLNTGITLSAGQHFSVTAATGDLWNAGELPRWSNANGLVADLFATGSDDSGLPAGTHIGKNFGAWSQNGLSAPYGALVGELAGTYFLLGTNFSGLAPVAGTLSLYYWDSNNGDNSGSVRADVTVPEPIALSLVSIGLLGVGFTRRKRA